MCAGTGREGCGDLLLVAEWRQGKEREVKEREGNEKGYREREEEITGGTKKETARAGAKKKPAEKRDTCITAAKRGTQVYTPPRAKLSQAEPSPTHCNLLPYSQMQAEDELCKPQTTSEAMCIFISYRTVPCPRTWSSQAPTQNPRADASS